MKLKACVVVCLSVFLLSSQLSAFDGQRKGFILGGGLGVGYLAAHEYTLDRAWSPAANFKIGYAPSSTLEISYTFVASGVYAIYDDADYFFGVNAIALTKYFKPEGPGFFITAGIGPALKSEMGYPRAETGFGFIGGLGYQLGRHWSLQGDVVYMNADSEDYAAIRLTFNFLAF
jgi:hypothetical protein